MRAKLCRMACSCTSTKCTCLYWRSRGRVVTSHQAAVIKRARFSAVIWEIPMLPAPSTSARQTTKGTQLPM